MNHGTLSIMITTALSSTKSIKVLNKTRFIETIMHHTFITMIVKSSAIIKDIVTSMHIIETWKDM